MRGLVWRHSLPLPLQRNRDAKVPHRPRPGVPPSLPPSLSFREVNWFWKSQKLPPHLAPPPSGATTCHLPIGATERMCSFTTKSLNEVGSGLGPLQGGCLHHHAVIVVVVLRPSKICDWLLNSSWDHFGLHRGEQRSERPWSSRFPKDVFLRATLSIDMVQWVLRWERLKRCFGRKKAGAHGREMVV